MEIINRIGDFLAQTGIAQFFNGEWRNLIMILIGLVFLYLAIKKNFEPYLLIPIAFGIILTNIPNAGIYHLETNSAGELEREGLLAYLHIGVEYEIYPCLIFLGIGATTDFGPLISNKKTMLLGAAAQIGIFVAFLGALALGKAIPSLGFDANEAASIGIIGGADGPTAILTATHFKAKNIGAITLAAYSYMALVPIIFPPIIRLFTTKKERQIKMEQLRDVSKMERILFPIIVTVIVALIVPASTPLIGSLMLGNLIKESGVVPNLVNTIANSLLCVLLLKVKLIQ